MPADKDIAEYLEDQSIGIVGTSIFVGRSSDTTDNTITVIQTQGMAPDQVVDFEFPGVQVIVRNSSYASGWDTINAIYKALHRLTNTTMESRTYHRIEAQGAPSFLGDDELARALFTVSFIATKSIE